MKTLQTAQCAAVSTLRPYTANSSLWLLSFTISLPSKTKVGQCTICGPESKRFLTQMCDHKVFTDAPEHATCQENAELEILGLSKAYSRIISLIQPCSRSYKETKLCNYNKLTDAKYPFVNLYHKKMECIGSLLQN